ncbi:hypothetical protein [Paraburkholderia solisilvae]|uniref:DUF5666 domain-containing protein n=1 Tax=Paraburkholderia solisilvae TaxID=624376 RepID=A0A6J5EN91_9BURK|nr:hypothetical protein [Paraburkholderia solisilvae]CAB3766686.1 hypothetical protein LMG29739_04894 [Paraburkholderia solisilvae]
MKRMNIAVAALMLSSAAAIAAPPAAAPARIRGTISSVESGKIVVHTTAGDDLPITLTADTKYLGVVNSSLDRIEPGSYIGTATKSVGPTQIALEVTLFPPAMKGIGEGHYAWDKLPDTTLSGHSNTSSAMTNGNVVSVSAPSGAPVNSAMTNGNVSAASAQNGVKKLTVSYNGGEQTVLVPPTAPVVTFRPGSTADLMKGASVFIQGATNGGDTTAGLVAVGIGGVKPPM